jgi:hypothetical protein
MAERHRETYFTCGMIFFIPVEPVEALRVAGD